LQFSLQAASPETFGYTLVYQRHGRTDSLCYLITWFQLYEKLEGRNDREYLDVDGRIILEYILKKQGGKV
jgi:hypothetical protein